MNWSDVIREINSKHESMFENCTIDLGGSLELKDIKGEKSILFENVSFSKRLYIKECKIRGQLLFINCHFDRGIEISKCEFEEDEASPSEVCLSIVSELKKESYSISIINCEFRNEVSISGMNLEVLQIAKNTFSKNFSIDKCTFNRIVDVNNNKFREFRVLENQFANMTGLKQIENSSDCIYYANNVFAHSLFIKDLEINDRISLHENIFNGELFINPFRKTSGNSYIILNGNTINAPSKIIQSKKRPKYELEGCKGIFVKSNILNKELSIIGKEEEIGGDYFGGSLKELAVVIDAKHEGSLQVKNMSIENVSLRGENYKGHLIFRNIIVSKLSVNSFYNFSQLQFNKIIPSTESRLEIVDSTLDNVNFVNCGINYFKKFVIYNSNLSKIRFANTKWFDYKTIQSSINDFVSAGFCTIKSEEKVFTIFYQDFYRNLREIFRQLKYASEQQGDKATALEFKSAEYKALYHVNQTSIKRNFNDRVILGTGYINNHGLSWTRPIGFLLLINIAFWVPLAIYKSSILSFSWDPDNFIPTIIEIFRQNEVYVQLLNPIHNLKDLFNQPVHDGVYWLDYLSRFINGFLIYEIIAGFRKFVK